MPPRLFLIDGHALAYRTYFALTRGAPNSFTTSSGEPTAGIFGFTSVLLRILEQEKGKLDYLAVAFDTGKTFRDEIYPDYKGTRAKMPDDLHSQIERIRQLVDAFGIPRLEMEGYEADDVLGSTAQQASQKGIYVKIITGDRDLLQLVNERIVVNLPGRSLSDSKDYEIEDVRQYMGVRPDQIVDLKALVGDKSDNIPGVAGVGEKTAISLLTEYDNLDSIYGHLDAFSPSIRNKLELGKESAQMSRTLAKIVTDLVIPWNLEKISAEKFAIDQEKIEAIFRQLEFRSLLPRLTALYPEYTQAGAKGQQLSLFSETSETGKSIHGDEIVFEVVDQADKLEQLVKQMEAAKFISFDTETTSTDQMRAKLVGISLAMDGTKGYYIPVGHSSEPERQLPVARVLSAIGPAMTDPNIGKIGHNLKYDYVVLARYGLRPSPLVFDTMIAEWLCNPASRNLGLKNLSWVRLDHKMTEIEELIGSGKNQIDMSAVSIDKAAAYAADDAFIIFRLMGMLEKELEQNHAAELMKVIEMPLITTLADMEMAGVELDTGYLAIMSEELTIRLRELEQSIYREVGEEFNLNSTQQLSVALFDKLKLPPPDRTRKTASGHYSTSADILEALLGKSPVVEWIMEYRELAKLKSTYVDALPLQVNPETGRVHTSYNQTGSVTGRIASSDPNLQNIPIRTELGRKVRHAFVAAPGNHLLSVDYSQVELRIVAHMADDQAMLDAFHKDQDIHAATAAAIFDVPLANVSKDQRRQAKAINFGLIYGMSIFGLTRTTDLTLAESENFVTEYFKEFPGVKSYLDQMRLLAAERGYVETLLGRRRYFPGLKNERNQNLRNRAEREAINAPVQGTAADIMKLAMVKLSEKLKNEGLSARLLLQVHDELVLECSDDELEKTAQVVCQEMETAYKLKIPLITEARYGPNWGTMTVLQMG